jgi:hypothetical protein
MEKWAFKLYTSKEKLWATPEKERGTLNQRRVVKRHNTLWLKRHQRYNTLSSKFRNFQEFLNVSLHRHHKSTWAPRYYSLTNNDNQLIN